MSRVEATGEVPNPLMVIGEAPGYEEQMEGRPFVGKLGKELWAALDRHCDLSRDDFYVTNLVKEGLPRNRDPKPDEAALGLMELLDEIAAVNPRVIVTAGSCSTRALLGDVKMADVHGIPHAAEIAGRTRLIHPIYHPAAGLHNKSFLPAFHFDCAALRATVDGSRRPWAATGRPTRCSWLLEPPRGDFGVSGCAVGVDTEGWADQPEMLSFSPDGQHGYVIPASATAALAWFSSWIAGKVIVIHNSLHDIPVLAALGIRQWGFLHDTMLLAYHELLRSGSGLLEAESQNLGTLAYREIGMRLGELADLPGVDLDARVIPHTDAVMRYAGADAIAAARLFDRYAEAGITEQRPYRIDLNALPYIGDMVGYGMPFDLDAALDYYTEVLEKFDDARDRLRTRAARLGNRDFNPGSHPQVRELITKKIGLRVRKRTKGGLASTNEKALADHQDHPFVRDLQTYRELAKLKGTYLLPLLEELQ